MIHIMKEKHVYQSRLRQEQRQRTREQILEGLVRTMARGITEVSIPAVAEEAGVSVPTVYRYFRTKRDLIEALGGYMAQKVGFNTSAVLPQSLEALMAAVKQLFLNYEGLDDVMRAAAISELSFAMRREAMPARLKMIEMALSPVQAKYSAEDWVYLCRIVLLLTSTATIRAFKDYLNLSGEEAANTVNWAIGMLTQSEARSEKEET